jgi:hypothetical protein
LERSYKPDNIDFPIITSMPRAADVIDIPPHFPLKPALTKRSSGA